MGRALGSTAWTLTGAFHIGWAPSWTVTHRWRPAQMVAVYCLRLPFPRDHCGGSALQIRSQMHRLQFEFRSQPARDFHRDLVPTIFFMSRSAVRPKVSGSLRREAERNCGRARELESLVDRRFPLTDEI